MTKVRPQFEEELEVETKRLHKAYRRYPASNFQEALGTVLHLARECLDSTSVERYADDSLFEYELSSTGDTADVMIYAKPNGPIEMTDSVLTTEVPFVVTPTAKIRSERITSEIDDIDGVIYANAYPEYIQVRISLDDGVEIQSVVDGIFGTLLEGIHNRESSVNRFERAVTKYADQRDTVSK